MLPASAQRMRDLEGRLFDCFGKWGYQEIIPPTFEYLDVLSAGLPAEVLEKCYKFADWNTGRILVLRPDVTAQIARMVAMGMAGQGLPLRLSYRTTVFRYEPEHAGREREIFQVGGELIGVDTPSMDAEILSLLAESLTVLGVPDFKISLGHVGFYKELLAKSNMSEKGRKQAEIAASHKDLPKLEYILKEERVNAKEAKALLEVPGRYGGEEVLKWGKKIAGDDHRLVSPLERLEQVYQLLRLSGVKDHLLLDLGEFRGFDYYDGLVFDVFSGTVGCELGGGGRYNHLIGRFGRDLPSTGFALDVDRIFGAVEDFDFAKGGRKETILLIGSKQSYQTGVHLSRCLRDMGFPLIHETLEGSGRGNIRELRDRAVRQGFRFLVCLGWPKVSADHVMMFPLSGKENSMKERKVAIHDLPAFLGEP